MLKIIQHCQEEGAEGDVVQGVLLGLVEGSKLEITNCFPFSQHSEENDEEDSKSHHRDSFNTLYTGFYKCTPLKCQPP